jgi:hypothetical protein
MAPQHRTVSYTRRTSENKGLLNRVRNGPQMNQCSSAQSRRLARASSHRANPNAHVPVVSACAHSHADWRVRQVTEPIQMRRCQLCLPVLTEAKGPRDFKERRLLFDSQKCWLALADASSPGSAGRLAARPPERRQLVPCSPETRNLLRRCPGGIQRILRRRTDASIGRAASSNGEDKTQSTRESSFSRAHDVCVHRHAPWQLKVRARTCQFWETVFRERFIANSAHDRILARHRLRHLNCCSPDSNCFKIARFYFRELLQTKKLSMMPTEHSVPLGGSASLSLTSILAIQIHLCVTLKPMADEKLGKRCNNKE